MNPSSEINPQNLRAGSEQISAGLPALIAKARRLAATLALGVHGRRRSGLGEEFWQYRQAHDGDGLRDIDWRRSSKGDTYFVKQTEWQSAQAVHFWVDHGASMDFRDGNPTESKSDRAQLLALAIALLLSKGGERFALLDDSDFPKTGESQIVKFATSITSNMADVDYSIPPNKMLKRGSHAVFMSDFLGNWDALMASISSVADQDVQGVLIQILDPFEVAFPFNGRTIFESMKSTLSFESRRADALKKDYLDRLAQRQYALENLAAKTGWRYLQHTTDTSAQSALLWAYNALEQGA